MTTNQQYFQYLKSRSFLGNIYRKYYLYPKLGRYLKCWLLDIGCGIGDILVFRSNSVGVDINPLDV